MHLYTPPHIRVHILYRSYTVYKTNERQLRWASPSCGLQGSPIGTCYVRTFYVRTSTARLLPSHLHILSSGMSNALHVHAESLLGLFPGSCLLENITSKGSLIFSDTAFITWWKKKNSRHTIKYFSIMKKPRRRKRIYFILKTRLFWSQKIKKSRNKKK